MRWHLPAALVAAVREIQSSTPLPWKVPVAPVIVVPSPGFLSLPSRARAPPRVSTLGGRHLGCVADRARLLSRLTRDQTLMMPDTQPMPDVSQRVQLPGAIRSHKVALPPVLTVNDTVNPLTYPLFASQHASRTDPSCDSYASTGG